jgi:F-type H+-transporting ATPase subunit epsilon
MSKTFSVTIIAPGREALVMEAERLTTLTKDGEVEFRANHTPIIVSTIPTTTLVVNGGNKQEMFTSSGIIYIKNNELKFCCDAVERPSDIDIDRAQESKVRAERRLKEGKDIDVERAKRSLARANARIGTLDTNN